MLEKVEAEHTLDGHQKAASFLLLLPAAIVVVLIQTLNNKVRYIKYEIKIKNNYRILALNKIIKSRIKFHFSEIMERERLL